MERNVVARRLGAAPHTALGGDYLPTLGGAGFSLY
jgi:hypothetical protein